MPTADAPEVTVTHTPSTRQALSAPPTPTVTRRHHVQPMRRVASHSIISLCDAAPLVEAGWSFDVSKKHGHVVARSNSAMDMASSVGASMLPSSNEFWNVFTEVLPIMFFCAVGLDLHLHPPTPMTATLRQAVLGTIWATVLQHVCSLTAHAGYRASARVSHAIWFVDYAGILCNFVWNSPPLAFAALPWCEWAWPIWRAANLVVTAALMGGGVWLACTHRPVMGPRGTEGSTTFFAIFSSSPMAFALLAVSVGTGLLATALAPIVGSVARPTAASVLPVLGASLAVKVFNVPERWLSTRAAASSVDLSFSPLHSHCLWHVGVFITQILYYSFFLQALAGRQTVFGGPADSMGMSLGGLFTGPIVLG